MALRALSAAHITQQRLEIPIDAFAPRDEKYLRSVGADPETLPDDPLFASVRVVGLLQQRKWNIAIFDARMPVTARQERPLGELLLPNAFVPEQAAAQTEQWVQASHGVDGVVNRMQASVGSHEKLDGYLLVVRAGELAVRETRTA